MIELPHPPIMAEDEAIHNTLHVCQFQTTDQTKAAVKGCWTPLHHARSLVHFQMPSLYLTRGHKPNPSGDFAGSLSLAVQKAAQPTVHDLYLLDTLDAGVKLRLEFFINSTTTFLS